MCWHKNLFQLKYALPFSHIFKSYQTTFAKIPNQTNMIRYQATFMELTNFVFSGRHELLPRHIITTTADSIIIIDQSNCKNKNCNENFQTPDENNPPYPANWTAWSAKWTTAYSFLSPLFRHRTTCGPYLGTLNFTRFIMSTNRTICRPHSSPQDIKALSLLSGHQSYTIHQTLNTPDLMVLGRNFP